MKTDNTSFVPYIADKITAETEKFFSGKFLNDIVTDYSGGKQSGRKAALFSASAFRGAAVAAPSELAAAAAGYLNTQPKLTAAGRFKAENGYINFYFRDEFIHAAIEYYSEQFDILYENGVFAKYLYGNESPVCGMRRYCINRIVSVCEMFAAERVFGINPSDNFTSDIQKELAEHCIFSAGSEAVSDTKAKRYSEFAAKLFYEADSCIKNASMIYLKLYKTCAYVLHTLLTEEGSH
ncbi:MAG: hypothetical protein IJZ94_04495 [Clostridia bacterium]|nr:hypothetical protein [Clostridia bacterium]